MLAPAAALLGGEALPRAAVRAVVAVSVLVQALGAALPYNVEYLDRAPGDPGPWDVWTPSRSPLVRRAVHVARLATGRPVLEHPPPGMSADDARAASAPNVFPARVASRGGGARTALALAAWLAALGAAGAAGLRLRRLVKDAPRPPPA